MGQPARMSRRYADFLSVSSARREGSTTHLPSLRGEMPARKLHYADNFELVAMRHREFRRSPNPSPVQLRRFQPLAARSAQRFLGLNRALCARHGYEHGDLLSYALVWTISFLGLYFKDARSELPNENEKLLCSYLKQRFAEFRSLLIKKGRSCFPDPEMIAELLLDAELATLSLGESPSLTSASG